MLQFSPMVLARLSAVTLLIFPILVAQELHITAGLQEEQVLQRDFEGFGQVALKGTATGKKTNGKAIEARVVGAGGVVHGQDWRSVGQIQKQAWSAQIAGIPTGGPYRLEVRVAGTTAISSVENILVGDLWILAGQSNMEGLGDLVDVEQPDPMVHSFDMADHWEVAQEPLHTLVGAADRVHWRRNAQGEYERLTGDLLQQYVQERKKGAGLGLPFAAIMAKRTGVPMGLVPCAHGGTSMEQWNPALRDQEGDSLYGAMYRRFLAVGGKVRGMLWYQGESDANAKAAPEFANNFKYFVKTVRKDFRVPELPFYYVQIGRHISDSNVPEWNEIQEAQLQAEAQIPNSGMVVSVDLSLDDGIHIGTADLKRLGRRLSDRVCHDLFPRLADYGELKPGPRPVSAAAKNGVVKVRFTGVNMRLESLGRIAGFSIHDSAGKPVAAIYKAVVDPAEASTVLLYVSGKLPEKASVWYGFGKDPYCNVHDSADFAVPVFGPLAIQE
jgi:sialate O-acetylesterase